MKIRLCSSHPYFLKEIRTKDRSDERRKEDDKKTKRSRHGRPAGE